MGNSVFFSFVLSLSIYLYWEYEKNDIECEFSTYLQHHKIQNLCGHAYINDHTCVLILTSQLQIVKSWF